VRLETRLSEIGALELRMKHSRSEQSWRLEFNTRAGEE
jgi:hypothetical protein